MSIASGAVFAQGEHTDDERPADDDAATDSDDTAAAVRIAHFSPDAPNVDVLVDGEQVLADVAYGTISPYLELEPGTYTVAIAAADDPETVAFEGEVDVGEGRYTVAAIGELGAETFRPEVLVDADPLPKDAADESAFVRVAHFSPDAPAVDVYADDAPLVEGVSFGDVSEYLAVPAGEYALSIRPAGEETEVASFDVSLESGTVYTGYAIGYLEPPEGVTDRDFTVELAVDGPEEDHPPEDAPGDGNGEDEPADEGGSDDQMDAAEEQKRTENDTKQTAEATTDAAQMAADHDC
ncbi:DUF4397 domain-containing protein [Natronococcus sp. JC468]|uniref:DUF4397 domain-containing protein n=1 Tax=Natronococcus sp. JC468 TaxID=1961921 RepID=UPI0014387F80|nr:DUF4397 domain-containing protein [Natronococcus sp. JC468]